jgi:aminoglycoside phosphotransferase (APT) family kinase protein
MEPIGPKIAEGRDAVIHDHGPGRVLRLARDGRSLVEEAEVMTYVRTRGFPAPEVFDAGAGYLLMERVDGPTMLTDALPLRIRRAARTLAGLHRQLHRIDAPTWLTATAPLHGSRLLHRDLHPMNVIVSDSGPVVIDWANASRGAPAFDVADTWVLFACADPPLGRLEALVAPAARRAFLNWFLAGLDRSAARRAIPAAVEHRLTDPNMTAHERKRMSALARWALGAQGV